MGHVSFLHQESLTLWSDGAPEERPTSAKKGGANVALGSRNAKTINSRLDRRRVPLALKYFQAL
jgi:hypothetical protein